MLDNFNFGTPAYADPFLTGNVGALSNLILNIINGHGPNLVGLNIHLDLGGLNISGLDISGGGFLPGSNPPPSSSFSAWGSGAGASTFCMTSAELNSNFGTPGPGTGPTGQGLDDAKDAKNNASSTSSGSGGGGDSCPVDTSPDNTPDDPGDDITISGPDTPQPTGDPTGPPAV